MKNRAVWIAILLVIMLTCSFFLIYYFINADKFKKDDLVAVTHDSNTHGYYDEILLGDNDVFYVRNKKEYLIIDNKDNVLEKLTEEIGNLKGYYDKYYSYQIGGTVYIKRDGLTLLQYNIGEKNYNNNYEILRDQSEKNTKYLVYSGSRMTKVDDNHIFITYNDYENTMKSKSLLFNIDTGLLEKTFDGTIVNVLSVFDDYLVLEESVSERYSFIDKKSFEITKTIEANLIGDKQSFMQDKRIISNNKDYLVIGKLDFVGLIDRNFNETVPCIYEDIFFSSKNSELLVAVKDEKYGVINTKNEEIIPFNYSYIEVHDRFIVAIQNNTMLLFDLKGSPITNLKFNVETTINYYRLCCNNENDFTVHYFDDNRIITFKDKDGYIKIDEKNNVTEYKEDYKTPKLEVLNKYYRYYVNDNKLYIIDNSNQIVKQLDATDIKYLYKSVYSVKYKYGYRYTNLGI